MPQKCNVNSRHMTSVFATPHHNRQMCFYLRSSASQKPPQANKTTFFLKLEVFSPQILLLLKKQSASPSTLLLLKMAVKATYHKMAVIECWRRGYKLETRQGFSLAKNNLRTRKRSVGVTLNWATSYCPFSLASTENLQMCFPSRAFTHSWVWKHLKQARKPFCC